MTAKPLFVLPEFEEDYRHEFAYYESVSLNLATRFESAVLSTTTQIESMPYRFGLIRNRIRAAKVRRFPFLVVFTVHRRFIRVVALHHVRKGSIAPWVGRL